MRLSSLDASLSVLSQQVDAPMHRQALLGFSLLDEDDGQAPQSGWLSHFPGQQPA